MNEPTDSPTTLVGTTAIVTGASRGFGRGISAALSGAGAHVVGVARTRADLDKVRAELGDTFTAVAADRRVPAPHPRAMRRGHTHSGTPAEPDLGNIQ